MIGLGEDKIPPLMIASRWDHRKLTPCIRELRLKDENALWKKVGLDSGWGTSESRIETHPTSQDDGDTISMYAKDTTLQGG